MTRAWNCSSYSHGGYITNTKVRSLLKGKGLILDKEKKLPPLSELQIDKLRRLTLVSLASESHVPPPPLVIS